MALVSLANRELSTHLPPTPMNHTIAVIDILDQTTQVPMELCSTPEVNEIQTITQLEPRLTQPARFFVTI